MPNVRLAPGLQDTGVHRRVSAFGSWGNSSARDKVLVSTLERLETKVDNVLTEVAKVGEVQKEVGEVKREVESLRSNLLNFMLAVLITLVYGFFILVGAVILLWLLQNIK